MKLFLLICATVVLANAAEKAAKNSTAKIVTDKDQRGKRNLNLFGNYYGAERRISGGNYDYHNSRQQPQYAAYTQQRPQVYSGYESDSSNYISGGAGPQHIYHHHQQPQYQEAPEPIIEIIIRESNETLPEQEIEIPRPGKKKKEQVQVFYVKYQKDDKHGLIIGDPVAALSPASHHQENYEEEEESAPYIVTPSPPLKTTTLRAIIRPDSEQYEAERGVHITFGGDSDNQHHAKQDNHLGEKREESAIQPVVAAPNSPRDQFKSKADQFQHHPRVLNNFEQNQNIQNNFVSPPFLSNQLTLPQNLPLKPFNPNSQFAGRGPQQAAFAQPGPHFQQGSQGPPPNFQQNQGPPPNFQQNQGPPPNFQQNQGPPPNFQQSQGPPSFPQNQIPQGPSQNFQQTQGAPSFPQNTIPQHSFQQPQFQQNQITTQHFGNRQAPIPQQQQFAQQPTNSFRPPHNSPPLNFIPNAPQRPPFNYHAHPNQVRFPPQTAQLQQSGPPPTQSFNQFQQNARPQQPKPIPIPLHNLNQQPPLNRPPQVFNNVQPLQQLNNQQAQSRPQFNQPFNGFNQQQAPKQPTQGQTPHFRQKPVVPLQQNQNFGQQVQPISQGQRINQQFQTQQPQQHFNQQFNDPQIFQGGLTEQAAPNLAGHRPQQTQQNQHSQQNNHHEHHNFQNILPPGGELVPSVSKYEHHITETVNGPIVYHQENIHMPSYHQNPQPQITPNSEPKQPRNGQSVSNHFSDVIPQLESQQKRFPNQNFLDVDVRSNNRQNSDEGRHSTPAQVISSTYRPTTVPARKEPVRSTTVAPISSTKKPSTYQLPDEVPDDLRQQLLSSGILDNADISVLDYDKLGETSLENLPPEHLANFFSAGGGTQIGASNKIVSVLKPNGDSINDKIKSLKSDTNIMKILDSTKKQPSKKEDINLKVVRFDSDSQKSVSNQYIKPDSAVLPSVDINQQIYNRYLPLKINGAQFPIPEELRGRKISSVVVLAPVDNLLSGDQATDDDGRYERDILDSRHVKFIAGDSLKQLLAKPTSENYKRWLEKEGKTETDLQSVVLLVTKDSTNADEQEIFMYDIPTQTVNKLNGELSTAFVNVAEENATAQDEESIATTNPEEDSTESIDTFQGQPSNIVETYVKFEGKKDQEVEPKIQINSGYSVIKNE